MSTATRPVRIALLGCGTVGTQVVAQLAQQSSELAVRVGAPLELVGIAVRDLDADRDPIIDRTLLTTDAAALVARDDVDLVVEVVGGIEPVRSLLLTALDRGASVVTANKALLAQDGASLFAAARASGADLYYEAAVAGAIPLLRPIRESLVGDRVDRVLGIVNGTCNFILTRMDETGAEFSDALAEATALGYAEADPTADIEGFDAAAKAAILASLAFHTRVTAADVDRVGITGVTARDISSARQFGAVVKLLAVAERNADGTSIGVRVHPAMVPTSHPLAAVREAFNAVFVEAAGAGELMFYGRGAGGAPTASAVLGDIVHVARNRVTGGRGPGESAYAALTVAPVGDAVTRFHVDLEVADRPGVLAQVAEAFAVHGVSIQAVHQSGAGNDARLVLVTHAARRAAIDATVGDLRRLDAVRNVAGSMCVLGEER